MTKHNLEVKGMHCKSCAMIVTDILQENGAKNISVNLDEKKQVGKVSFEFSGDKKKVVDAIEKEDYKVT